MKVKLKRANRANYAQTKCLRESKSANLAQFATPPRGFTKQAIFGTLLVKNDLNDKYIHINR